MSKITLLTLLGMTFTPLDVNADDVFMYLRGGSVVRVAPTNPEFEWIDISDGENSARQKIRWSDVARLSLTDSQVDEQLRTINRWLEQLNHQSYAVREHAEKQLSNPDNSAAYKSVIRRFGETIEDDEVRYRIGRILEEISDLAENFGTRFDRLELKDGTIRTGNVSKFAIVGLIHNKPIRFDRKQVQKIFAGPIPPALTKTTPLSVKTYNTVDSDRFYDEQFHSVVSFETDRFANPTVIGKEVDEMFTHQGVLMGTEQPGHMILVKYEFKFCPVEAGSRCICPYDEETQKRLRGVTLISFCLPDQPGTAAGVHEFGIFLERIEHSRDVVVEAYNIHGQMLGMVEATDQICVFAGFESNEPITQIRILRNPDLPDLDRLIDETYAFDALTFSQPVPVPELTRIRPSSPPFAAQISFVDGQVLHVTEIQLEVDGVTFTNPVIRKTMTESWDKIRSIAMPSVIEPLGNGRGSRASRSLMVQLNEGSIVRTENRNYLASYDFIGQSWKKDQIVGVWNRTARCPHSSDFELGEPVIVYPSCRILSKNLKMNPASFSWDQATSKKIIQPVLLHDDNEDFLTHEKIKDPDLTPQVDQVDLSSSDEEIPSLWFRQPVSVNLSVPHVRLIDGQLFLLGENGSFSVKSIDSQKKTIEIGSGGFTKVYPLSRVASIALPDSSDQP